MHDKCCDEFQQAVEDYLIRHKSILDVMSKYQESSARVNRAMAKAVTQCGCIEVHARRQQVPQDVDYSDTSKYMSTHMSGDLCESCRETIAEEVGHNLFYLAALCNLSGINLKNVIAQECREVTALGPFHLT